MPSFRERFFFRYRYEIWKSSNERATAAAAALATSTAEITSINIKKLGPYYHTHIHIRKNTQNLKSDETFSRMNPIRHVQGNTKFTLGMGQTDRRRNIRSDTEEQEFSFNFKQLNQNNVREKTTK